MTNYINTRIQHKIDTLDRWTDSNPTLLLGEIAIVHDSSNDCRIKIGNGTSLFNDLPYIYDNIPSVLISIDGGKTTVNTNEILFIKISEEDYNNLVASDQVLSNAIYEVSSTYENMYGQQLKNVADPTDDLDAATKNYVDVELSKIDVSEQILPLSNEISSKIVVANGINGEFTSTDLSVINLTQDEYIRLILEKQINPSVVYNVSSISSLNGLSSAILNVGEPVLSNDAATKNYVDENCSKCLMRVWTEE